MSNYFNDAGEPLMDGAAMRYEMYLDSLDEDFDGGCGWLPDGPSDFDFIECLDDECDEDVRDCGHDGITEDVGMEDSWLDGSYEE